MDRHFPYNTSDVSHCIIYRVPITLQDRRMERYDDDESTDSILCDCLCYAGKDGGVTRKDCMTKFRAHLIILLTS